MKEIKLNYNVPFSILESADVKENFDFLIQGIAINATITGNNHKFLAEELRESANSLTGVPLLVDHKNEISAIKGRVIKGEFSEENQRIDFKAKVVDNEIKQMVKDGLINSVSVGAAVREIEEVDDVLIPRGIVFKELSLVAVPADSGATFTTALQEAYKLQEKEEMVKCKECDKMIPKDKMKEHMDKMHPKDSQSEVTLQSMKGGIKMSEEITEKKVPITEAPKLDLTELKAIQADISAKLAEMKTLSEKKVEKVEVKEVEVEEDADVKVGKYKFMFENFGGKGSCTLVR